ncbi:MAG: hypothetical protein GXY89_05950 [Tissierellia bacterium]|nr:hypothetical protein [Tissierellia bacterium]
MKFNIEKDYTKDLLNQLLDLYNEVLDEGNVNLSKWEKNIERVDFYESAKNLFYYLALRTKSVQDIQNQLIPWGLSSLGRLESKTLPTLQSVIFSLSRICGEDTDIYMPNSESFYAGKERLDKNTKSFYGEEPKDYRTRIMVTLPSEASEDNSLIEDLIKAGMNVARINCSHDNEKTWLIMINKIRRISKKENKDVKILMDLSGPKIRTDWVFSYYENSKVVVGDLLRLANDFSNINPKEEVKLQLGTTIPQVFKHLKVGDHVMIDDGTIETSVVEVDSNGAIIRVDKLKGRSKRLRPQKGINFPDTDLEVNVLSKKDKEDMRIACEHADIIGCSFIRTSKDIIDIQNELDKILKNDGYKMPLMAKIETVSGVDNLPEIILQGASKNPFSVMIARGDLAVESGYARLAELQQEILWICEAADIPVVWATEVFSNLVKSGIPTRAEVTDATEGTQAECVMLNKGDFLVEGIEMLQEIFTKMQEHQYKKTSILRPLNIANISEK